ncbi:hypothetical protein M0G43_14025 [Subsaxibacter sp. CAU 1640]|uniref:hypothetical protein n=1 Tax=Subsaxibacter sp. CAU 1640 TaxID=2933271 RepID=UPI0020052542|nr:hypothetical protein [Subsaxibacter sp. CAU 1640]MCK7591702.1 hypothetical protein [Subsaxibacter sp. CAU 1640]
MHFNRLVPNVYYKNINDGLKMFVDCLGFKMGHEELKSKEPFCVIEGNEFHLMLFQHEKLAKEHQPEFRLVTKNIEDVYQKVSTSHPEYLHPNLNKVTLRPWGAKEFALRDGQVCLIIQQW